MYLEIAREVLRTERRPLSARSILAKAYRAGVVPANLHGRTQHKTLQARISEDILKFRERSVFYRTAPGRFFLTEFLTDDSIPEEHRQRFPARRRLRELVRSPVLRIRSECLQEKFKENSVVDYKILSERIDSEDLFAGSIKDKETYDPLLRSFVCVVKDRKVLSYRIGAYRDDRDEFTMRRCIGFTSLVKVDDNSFFGLDSFGVIDAGVNATAMDLDIQYDLQHDFYTENIALRYFFWFFEPPKSNDFLAVIYFRCPKWFEPTRRRLALNDLRWLDLDQPQNDLTDFDPWSRAVLENHYSHKADICE